MKPTNKKIKVLFLAAGIPVAIGTGFVEFVRFGDIRAAIIVAFVGFILIGASLLLSSIGFTRFDRKVWWATVIHFVLLPIAGVILTGSYYIIAQYTPVGSWVAVENPPEQIDHFLPSEDPTIFGYSLFVKSIFGTIYSYNCVTYEACNWVQREYTPEIQDANESYKMTLKNRLIPIPPGRIVESQHNFGRGPDFETGIMFIRLADGRIYYWTQFWSVYDTLFMLFGFSLTGLITGLSTSIFAFRLRPRRIIM